MTMDRNAGINDVLHLLSQTAGIVGCHGTPYLQVHIVAIADRYVDTHFTGGASRFVEQFVGSLTEDKKQCTRVCANTTGRCDVQKLNLFLLVDAVVHTFYFVVDTRRDWTVCQCQITQHVGIYQRAAHRHLYGTTVVTDMNFNSFFHIY